MNGLDPDQTQEHRLVEQFLALTHVDSPPLHEGRIMRLLAPQLQALGFKVVFDRAHEPLGGEVGNLIASLPGRAPDAVPIFLSAHVDTVSPTAGIKTVVENGIIRTDGTTILGADDKAAVAAILEAVRTVVTHELPHGPIQVLFSICEEVGLKGAAGMDYSLIDSKMGFVVDSSQPSSCVVVQSPTHDVIQATFHGKKAHAGGAPETGVSAIQAAAAAISRMKLGRIDEETTANMGTIHGGEATNIIPDRTELLAEARSRDPHKLEDQVNHMLACLQEGAAAFGATVETEVHRHYETFRLSPEDPVVRLACAAIERTGRRPRLVAGGGGSDASIFNARGLPAVVMGVGYRNIHTTAEAIAITDLVATYKIVLALIQEAARA